MKEAIVRGPQPVAAVGILDHAGARGDTLRAAVHSHGVTAYADELLARAEPECAVPVEQGHARGARRHEPRASACERAALDWVEPIGKVHPDGSARVFSDRDDVRQWLGRRMQTCEAATRVSHDTLLSRSDPNGAVTVHEQRRDLVIRRPLSRE